MGQLGHKNNRSLQSFTRIEHDDLTKIELVACGYEHTIVSSAKTIFAFGSNKQVSQWPSRISCCRVNSGALARRPCPLHRSSSLSCASLLKPVSGGLAGKVSKRLSCGAYFSLVLTTDFELWAFGCNAYNQISQSSTSTVDKPTRVAGLESKRVIDASAGFYHVAAICAALDAAPFPPSLLSSPKLQVMVVDRRIALYIADDAGVSTASLHSIRDGRSLCSSCEVSCGLLSSAYDCEVAAEFAPHLNTVRFFSLEASVPSSPSSSTLFDVIAKAHIRVAPLTVADTVMVNLARFSDALTYGGAPSI